MCNASPKNEYAITLKGDSALCFTVYADDFELTRCSISHEPYAILFGIGNYIVCSVRCSDVAKIELITDGKRALLYI